MCETDREKSDEAFIARAYIALSSAVNGKQGERIVLLKRIRNYEIRMVETSQLVSADGALFWIELFDRNLRATVDSCRCSDFEEAAAAYDDLVSQTNDN